MIGRAPSASDFQILGSCLSAILDKLVFDDLAVVESLQTGTLDC